MFLVLLSLCTQMQFCFHVLLFNVLCFQRRNKCKPNVFCAVEMQNTFALVANARHLIAVIYASRLISNPTDGFVFNNC
jgi:hypothetical protein